MESGAHEFGEDRLRRNGQPTEGGTHSETTLGDWGKIFRSRLQEHRMCESMGGEREGKGEKHTDR